MSLRGGQLYFDCFAGIAGDMTVGALIDLGVPEAAVREALAALPVDGYELRVGRAVRCGIAACDVKVMIGGKTESEHEHVHVHEHVHEHEHEHEHGHEHVHGHEHEHEHALGGHGHRHWREIRGMLERLPDGVRRRATAIFERVAEAEGKIHGVPVDDVAFHEVGAIDSIVDIVGAAAAIEWLAPVRITARAVPLGSGSVRAAHGNLPVPAPATLEILRGAPTEGGGPPMELTTPTGAAILAATCDAFGAPPVGRALAIGYGAGDRDPPDRPNVLRAIVYAPDARADAVWQLEANIDDMNPELCEPLLDALFTAGALDAWLAPIQMKKGRPAIQVGALVAEPARDAVAGALLRESTTIGVRWWRADRRVLDRRIDTVPTPYGPIAVKVALDGEAVVNAAPEYESCRAAAKAAGVPVKEVYAAAAAAWRTGR